MLTPPRACPEDVTIYQRDSTYIMTTKRGMPGMLGRTSLSRALSFLCHAHPSLRVDLWWEGGWPTDVADRIDASLPTFLTEEISKRHTAAIAEGDKYVARSPRI